MGFASSAIPVSTCRFVGKFDVIIDFLEPKNIPKGIYKARGYFNWKLSKKMLCLAPPFPSPLSPPPPPPRLSPICSIC